MGEGISFWFKEICVSKQHSIDYILIESTKLRSKAQAALWRGRNFWLESKLCFSSRNFLFIEVFKTETDIEDDKKIK
jgi:hypothetical protein